MGWGNVGEKGNVGWGGKCWNMYEGAKGEIINEDSNNVLDMTESVK